MQPDTFIGLDFSGWKREVGVRACVRVCVCVRERDRQTDRQTDRDRET